MYCANKDVKLEKVNENISRKILSHNGKLMAVEVHFKGPITDPGTHSHPHEQIAYVVKGRFEFHVKGQKLLLEAGDSIYFEPDVVHGALLLSEEGVLLDVFTPQRSDFI